MRGEGFGLVFFQCGKREKEAVLIPCGVHIMPHFDGSVGMVELAFEE